jgi:sterol 3beta-glucosyltransferase
VATAIESIYRDLEYSRSLIKRAVTDDMIDDEVGTEHSTIREYHHDLPSNMSLEPRSGYSSNGSARGAPSEDWSVISEQDDRRSSFSSRHSDAKPVVDQSSKRNSLAAAVLSVLPDALTPASPRRRTLSASSSRS